MRGIALAVVAVVCAGVTASATAASVRPAGTSCSAAVEGPGAPYYAIDLVPTGRVPGTRRAKGEARVAFARSPFGVAITPGGRYVYDLSVEFRDLSPPNGAYAIWIAKADLSETRFVGVLNDSTALSGTVDWNKFLVVVTLEPDPMQLGETWQGPIVFRGMSRSGRMHTMAGHGPFQAEPCSKYGY